jgi:DNA-binding LacI/PurR family transcriptional regulator
LHQPTINDVARLSGVSKSTVSNVIRGAEYLADDTRERVLAAIDELGYRPNALARSLQRRQSALLGLVVGDLTNPFYAELSLLIEQHAAQAGYATIICNTDGGAEAERKKFGLLLEQRVSGVVMLHFSGEHELIASAEQANVPVVGVSTYDRAFDCIAIDDAKGARLAVEHLIGLGHERVAYVPSSYPEASANAARSRGWSEALRRAGLPRPAVVNLPDEADGRVAALAELMDGPDAPTGFFVGNDVTALHFVDALERTGLSVPRDASVVGFDDIAVASLGRIELTTIHQPTHVLARRGIERLLYRIGAGSDSKSGRNGPARMKPQIVVRASTAPPR